VPGGRPNLKLNVLSTFPGLPQASANPVMQAKVKDARESDNRMDNGAGHRENCGERGKVETFRINEACQESEAPGTGSACVLSEKRLRGVLSGSC
jgi:hypothetical protein